MTTPTRTATLLLWFTADWRVEDNRVHVRCRCGWTHSGDAGKWRVADAKLAEHIREAHGA